jgi:hypothetical protein
MKEQRRARASHPHQRTSGPWRGAAFPTTGFDTFLAAQRDSAEAVAASYRKAFEGWARILKLQSNLARSLYERSASIGTDLYRNRDRPDAANTVVEATQGATEDIVRTTQEIVDTACACCVDAVKVYSEYANRQSKTVHDAAPSGMAD